MDSSNLRILFISKEYPPQTWGGIASYVSTLAPALASRGHEVHLISCIHGQQTRDYEEQGVWVHRRGLVRLRGLGRLTGAPTTTSRVKGALSAFIECRKLRVNFDVVEVPNWGAEGLVFSLVHNQPVVACLSSPAGLLAREEGLAVNRDRSWADLLERQGVARADIALAGSHFHLRELLGSGWLRHETTRVGWFPVDVHQFAGLPPPSACEPTVLQVGRLERRKNPELAIEAMARVRRRVPEARIVFVGRDGTRRGGSSYQGWLEQMARSHGVPVEFRGEVSKHQLIQLYGQARVVVQPSTYESFGLTCAEGMAAERPVVITDRVGAADILSEEAGAVVPSNHPEALAEAMARFLSDPALANRAGRMGRRLVQDNLAPGRIAVQREKIYHEAISKRVEDVMRTAKSFPYSIPKRVEDFAVPQKWRGVAIEESIKEVWKHGYLRLGEQLLRLLSTWPPLKHKSNLEGISILDLGCTPMASLLLTAMGADVVMLDIAQPELDKARQLARRVQPNLGLRLVNADAFAPPFRSRSFDVVLNNGFIEHFDDPVKVVRLMGSLTRPGGAVCVTVPATRTLHSAVIRSRLRRSSRGYLWDFMGHERSYTEGDLRRIMDGAGVASVSTSLSDLRRNILDDNSVLRLFQRFPLRLQLFPIINAIDAIERRFPPARKFGFVAGAIGIVEASH